ncbi:MAG: acyltransferase family protein [Actinobacteria bacterium]|uniref:Unannotated protein n=1 Tax=freshwater metagenome TaxID=449393 RepID=A0A6J6XUK1_9ZZZZ|nr:acyltransferase family protein [Actinomycetota bacterium]
MDGFRPDIEGLRAVAVVSVVLYHADLLGFRGGYIGVDVFFVLSGFLITRLLAGEVSRTGTISLRTFWARRARRLLPASSLTLVATVVASRFLVDPLTRGFIVRSGLASAGFAANILFWSRGGYSQVALPEPLLHFWSLAVEEQFYLFWPLLLLAAARTGRRFTRTVVLLSLVIGGASLWLCISQTPRRDSFTFYWLPARAWEFLAGALLAVAPIALTRRAPFLRAVLGWAGLAVLALGWFTFGDPEGSFPGYRALLPVLATSAVILGGAAAPDGPVVLLGLRPFQWLGKRSYAIYLWHFPLLVLADAKWGPLPAATRAALLVGAVLLAALTFVLVEHPVRSSVRLAARPAYSLALGIALVATAVAASIGVGAGTDRSTANAEVVAPTLATLAPPETDAVTLPATDGSTAPVTTALVLPSTLSPLGSTSTSVSTTSSTSTTVAITVAPPSVDNQPSLLALAVANRALVEEAITNELVPANLEPSLDRVFDERPIVYSDGCMLGIGQSTPKPCEYGDTTSAVTVVLMGDSHAAQWFPAFEATALKHHWRLVLIGKRHCPVADTPQSDAQYTRECAAWRRKAIAKIREMKPAVTVLTQFWYPGPSWSGYRLGLERSLRSIKEVSGRVVLMGDVPRHLVQVPTCVSAHPKSLTKCLVDRATAINSRRAAMDAEAVRRQGVDRVRPDDWLCGASRCPAVIGNILVYRDDNHISPAAASFLAPYVETMLLVYLPLNPTSGPS